MVSPRPPRWSAWVTMAAEGSPHPQALPPPRLLLVAILQLEVPAQEYAGWGWHVLQLGHLLHVLHPLLDLVYVVVGNTLLDFSCRMLSLLLKHIIKDWRYVIIFIIEKIKCLSCIGNILTYTISYLLLNWIPLCGMFVFSNLHKV